MSWLSNPYGEPPRSPRITDDVDPLPKVPDPSNPNRLVSSRQSNQPYLAYKEYRDKKEAEHQAWVERMKEREEKIKRGEEVGPAERDPTEEVEVGCVGLIKLLLTLILLGALAGKFFTGSYTWEHTANLKKFWPTHDTFYSEKGLARFDGTDPGKPILLGIDGDVYDVSANRRTYGPGGSYHVFAGKDAARAFVTGCFKEHQTHDIRDFGDKELASLQHWKQFFATHREYKRVGKVGHAPIDPSTPIPLPCKKSGQEAPEVAPKPQPVEHKHDEL